MHGRLGCSYLLAIFNNAAINIGVKYQFESLLLILMNVYLKVKWLDCMIIVFILGGTIILFATVAAHFFITTNLMAESEEELKSLLMKWK